MGLAPTKNISELVSNFRSVKKSTGKSYNQLFREALRLRYGKTGIGFSEFFGYQLFDTNSLCPKTIKSFVSVEVSDQIWEHLNPPQWWGLVMDKVAFQLMMERMGFAQPKLLAFYAKDGRRIPGIEALHSIAQIEEFLSKTTNYPIFAKPSDSYRSFGAVGIKNFDINKNLVSLQNGEEMPISRLLDDFAEWDDYLFQESLLPHETLRDISGNTLSTMRMVVLYMADGPQLFRVVWKIPNAKNMADNFWRPGNLVAHLNVTDGMVYKVLRSTETGHKEVGRNEILGKRFLSTAPPHYEEATELVLEASRAFSMFTYQAWDIALSDQGPVALELNHNGDIELLQVGARVGILDDQFNRLLVEKRLSLKNPKRILG